MVHVSLVIFFSVIESAFSSTAVEVCAKDKYNLDVCSESKDASFFLQSSKTAIRAADTQPKVTKKQKNIEKHLEHMEEIDAAKMKAELAAAVKVLKGDIADPPQDVFQPNREEEEELSEEELLMADEKKHEDTELTETEAVEEKHVKKYDVKSLFSELIEDEEKENASSADDLKKYLSEFTEEEEKEQWRPAAWGGGGSDVAGATLRITSQKEQKAVDVDHAEEEKKRIDAKTGVALTLDEFKTFFGDEWKERWEAATHVMHEGGNAKNLKSEGTGMPKRPSAVPVAKSQEVVKQPVDRQSKQVSAAPVAKGMPVDRKAQQASRAPVAQPYEAVKKPAGLWSRVWHHKKGPPKPEEAQEADALDISEEMLTTEALLKENVTARSRVSKVAEFDCTANGGPLQLLMEGRKGFVLKALNVETGKYSKVFSIPFKRTTPKYSDMNSCGVNPIDGILYCGIKSGENYIVRVDDQQVEFVAKLPGNRHYTSGTFGPGGSFFIANDKAQFVVVPDLSKTPGYPGKKNGKLLDLSGKTLIKPKGFQSAADVVTVRANLDGLGEKVYVIVVNKGVLQIATYEDNVFKKTWVIKYKRGNKKGTFKEKFGAGWSFGGKVFFASNDGFGVFQVPLDDLDLSKAVKALEPITMPRIGASDKSGNNDGANCMNAPDPWATKVAPWDCKLYAAPVQVMQVKTGYAVRTVNMATGAYTEVFNLPYAKTSPPYKFLNAVGISPVDGIPYGCLLFGQFPAAIHIVRFDKDKFEFVAKIPGSFDPIAGSFASTGEFFFVHNTKNSRHPVLYSIPGLDGMKGYANHANPKLPVLKGLTGFTLTGYTQVADIVAVKYPLEGPEMGEYILGINRDRQVALVKWNAIDPSKSKLWKLRTNDVTASVGAYENFGAAWNYEGRVFFSSNDGIGVFETKQINLKQQRLTLKKVGKSARIYNNDGFNCWKVESPFPNANPKLRVMSAFKVLSIGGPERLGK
mmetsp:Transcript_82575/g.151237  ORF Transcript_82575/g.151237 Transcript_82575/m.151237 type:complete len:975 (-) Transcript_82575:92-3016(-)